MAYPNPFGSVPPAPKIVSAPPAPPISNPEPKSAPKPKDEEKRLKSERRKAARAKTTERFNNLVKAEEQKSEQPTASKPKPKPKPKTKPKPKPKKPQSTSTAPVKHSFDLIDVFVDEPLPPDTVTAHAQLLGELALQFLAPPSFSQRMTLVHPLTPLKSVSVKAFKKSNSTKGVAKPQITLHLGVNKTSEDILPLLDTIKDAFTSIYRERLICYSCQNRIKLGEYSCSCHSNGCKKLLGLPATYSEFVPVQMANKIHRDKLKPASVKDFDRLSSKLCRDSEGSLEQTFETLALSDSTTGDRNAAVEKEFIEYINGLSMKTILRQRVRGFRTRPLSLSASNIKSASCLKEIIHENTETRIMTADLSQLSPMYDNLIDELGNCSRYPRWDWASSKGASFDFGEFGNVRIKGSPDAMFDGIPVELKTVKSSLKDGATREKIQAWSLQVAAYQLTHGEGEGPGPAILLVVSLEDLEVLALNVWPDNFVRARSLWLRNLTTVFGGDGNLYRKYWDNLVSYHNEDSTFRAKHHHNVLRSVLKWQEEDAEREIEEGMSLVPRIWESGVAAQFERKVSLGRKLCLKGRKTWQAKKEDRTARKILNSIKKETQELWVNGNSLVVMKWAELKRMVEGGLVAVDAVKPECKICLDILSLMKTIARWRDVSKEIKAIDKATTEIKDTMKGWVKLLGNSAVVVNAGSDF